MNDPHAVPAIDTICTSSCSTTKTWLPSRYSNALGVPGIYAVLPDLHERILPWIRWPVESLPVTRAGSRCSSSPVLGDVLVPDPHAFVTRTPGRADGSLFPVFARRASAFLGVERSRRPRARP